MFLIVDFDSCNKSLKDTFKVAEWTPPKGMSDFGTLAELEKIYKKIASSHLQFKHWRNLCLTQLNPTDE